MKPQRLAFAILLALGGSTFATQAEQPADQPMDASALAARIDQLIAKQWADKGIEPAPIADDAEFIRRVYLDLLGRIPPVADVREFLADKRADKRARLINRLLDHPLYTAHLSTTWRSILLPPTNQQIGGIAGNFKLWLEKQVKENTPYDKMVRDMLTVQVTGPNLPRGDFVIQGNQPGISPVGFLQANELKPENLASSASRVFLGVRLECAQCHDHPFAKWTRGQFWQFAAFFSAIQPGQPVRLVNGKPERPVAAKRPTGRDIKIPNTDKVVPARFLDDQEPEWKDGIDSRAILADWITSPTNPYFARTGANRIWGHLFGIGIIDPVDDEPGDENPISHPEVLDLLSRQFVAHKFDVKYVLRAILMTQTYQRTSRVTHESQNDARSFARMSVRGLTPEQLFDSLAQATGYYEAPQFRAQAGLVIGGNPNNPRSEFLGRFSSQDKKTETQTSILQALALMNGKFVADATSVERSMTLSAAAEFPGWSTEQRIETLYLAALSRLPRQEELVRLTAYVNQGGPSGDQRRALADVFWVLLNSSEFILNH
jgi:hypothetical protein